MALSASAKGIDGYFTEGLLQGKSVNVKWYTQAQGLLDITPNYLPDYYLVLSGPKSAAMSSRGQVQPWLIENVFVFHAQTLLDALSQSGVKVGIATSVRQYLWEEARIFPKQCSSLIHLSEVQRYLLMLFGAAPAHKPMQIKTAKQLATEWINTEAIIFPGFLAAFFHGSITWLDDGAILSPSSDVDIMVVLSGEMPAVKLGKFRYRGVLLEVSYLSADEVSSTEQVLSTFYLAGSLRTATIIADPTSKLTGIQQMVAQDFAKPQWVRARCQQAADKMLDNLQSLEAHSQFHDQVSAWLFGTSLTTIVLLLAGLKNPTVRKRYVAVKELLAAHGHSDFYEELLDLLGCRQISQERCQVHLDELTEVFDVAKTVVKTPIFFASDISDDARLIAIDGSREMIENGLQREAIFWLVATYARCLKILNQDAPHAVYEHFDSAFRALLADLGIRSLDDMLARRAQVKVFLPRLWETAEIIIAETQAKVTASAV